jgi:hypothetical protein
MSKVMKRVVFGILAMAVVLGTLSASARPREDPEGGCNPNIETCYSYGP